MASEDVPAFNQALTADGTNKGVLAVGDTSGFYPGAFAWLSSNTQTSQYCQITSVADATHVSVRFLPDPGAPLGPSQPNYGGADASAFKLADSAKLSMFAQPVRVTQPQFSKRSQA